MTDDFPTISSRVALFSRDDVLSRPCPVPRSAGVYAWYFAAISPGIDPTGCHQADGLPLHTTARDLTVGESTAKRCCHV